MSNDRDNATLIVETVLDILRADGYSEEDISLIMKDATLILTGLQLLGAPLSNRRMVKSLNIAATVLDMKQAAQSLKDIPPPTSIN